MLGGGLPSNRLYVVEGNPGSGKTTFALQFLREGVRLGQRSLYITLSETRNELSDVAVSHGWTLEGIDLLELSTLSERVAEEANYTVYNASDVELGETINRIRAEIERLSPERLALGFCLTPRCDIGAKYLALSSFSLAGDVPFSCSTIAPPEKANDICRVSPTACFEWSERAANMGLQGVKCI